MSRKALMRWWKGTSASRQCFWQMLEASAKERASRVELSKWMKRTIVVTDRQVVSGTRYGGSLLLFCPKKKICLLLPQHLLWKIPYRLWSIILDMQIRFLLMAQPLAGYLLRLLRRKTNPQFRFADKTALTSYSGLRNFAKSWHKVRSKLVATLISWLRKPFLGNLLEVCLFSLRYNSKEEKKLCCVFKNFMVNRDTWAKDGLNWHLSILKTA